MGFYEIRPSIDVDYFRVRLWLLVGKYVEMIYWHDPKTQSIKMYMRTEANPNTLRQFFFVRETDESEVLVPKYVAEVTLATEGDFYAPIRFHDLSSFVLALPEGYQLRIWVVYDNMLTKALRWKLENPKGNKRLTIPQQMAAAMLKGNVYLVKIYIMGDKRSEIAKLVDMLSNFVVPVSGRLSYKLVKVPQKKKKNKSISSILKKLFGIFADVKTDGSGKKWTDTMPKITTVDLLAGLRLWLWTIEDYLPLILPFPKTGKVKLAASNALPYVKYDRKDFLIGRDLMYDEDVYLDWTDFQRHALILGSTGSGKSNTLEILAQELMKYGLVVFVDPNSQSARKLSKLANYYFTIGGPNEDPNFGINVLKIPPYFKNRDEAVDYVVSKAVQLFKKMLNLDDSAVYVKFVIAVVLRALLKRYDEITFEDVYETLLGLWNEELDINELLDPEDRRAASELEFLQGLQSQTFASVLARLEDFVNNRKFRIITAQKTIDWDRIMKETGGKGLVVFDVGKGENEDLAISVMGLITIDMFNYVYLRDMLGMEPKPIFFIVDEAHNITHFDFIPLIFKEARKYGLHMILATQSLASIINTAGTGGGAEINNNTNVKILMKAIDALEVKIESEMVGGQFADKIRSMLPQLGIGQAFLILTPRPGEIAVPKLVQIRKSELELPKNVTPTTGFEPKLSRIPKVGHPIRMFFPRDYPFNPVQQRILFLIHMNGGRMEQPDLLRATGLERDKLGMEVQKLESFISVSTGDKGAKVFTLRDPSWILAGLKAVAPSQEGLMITANVLAFYVHNGYYTIPARQSPELKYRPDLIAVKMTPDNKLNYDENVAIEIESPNELTTSPQQVAKNMRKYAEQEMRIFKEVHFWTTDDAFPKLKEIYDTFLSDPTVPDEVKAKVKIFMLQVPKQTERKAPQQQGQGRNAQQQQNVQQKQQVKQEVQQVRNDGATQSGTDAQPQGPPDPAVDIQVNGKTVRVHKYSGIVEIDGKKYRIPPFEAKRIISSKDSIADVSVAEDGKKMTVRYKDGSSSDIILS